MSRSSCSSSRAESGSAQRRKAGTPVKYRRAPYDYSPEMRCDCGEKMPRLISWTDENTAGQFSSCPIRSGRNGIGCSKFKWIELPLTGFHKELVQDLRDAVWDKNDRIRDLEEEVRKLSKEHEDKGQRGSSQAQLHKPEAETGDLRIRRNSTDNILVIWALSVAFAVYVGMVLSSS